MSKIKVRWYCGHPIGPPEWRDTDYHECPECDTEFETENDLDNWIEKLCRVICPGCGGELNQRDDAPDLLGQI